MANHSFLQNFGNIFSAKEEKQKEVLINDLLKDNLLISIFNLIDIDYSLTSLQEKKLKGMLIATLKSDSGYKAFARLLEKENKSIDKYLAYLIIHDTTLFSEQINYNTTIAAWYKEKQDNKELYPLLFQEWKQSIKNIFKLSSTEKEKHYDCDTGSYLYTVTNKSLEYFGNSLFNNVELQEIQEVIKLFKKISVSLEVDKYSKSLVQKIMNQVTRNYEDKIKIAGNEVLKQKLNITEENNYQDINEYLDNIKITVNNINIVSTIEKIQKTYILLQNDKSELEYNHIYNMDNVFYKRVPQLLNQYMSISLKARNTIESNNKQTASEIINESLNDINEIFKSFLTIINEKKLSELSVSNRYFNEVKKGM